MLENVKSKKAVVDQILGDYDVDSFKPGSSLHDAVSLAKDVNWCTVRCSNTTTGRKDSWLRIRQTKISLLVDDGERCTSVNQTLDRRLVYLADDLELSGRIRQNDFV